MHKFNRLTQNGENFYINQKITFRSLAKLDIEVVFKVFDFSYNMTFGNIGEHRNYRSGGTHKRKNGEIFANTFQGKLSEFALTSYLRRIGLIVSDPDIEMFGLGKWDDTDIEINGIQVSIKSTKSFGNLLLLETNDWDNQGLYIPNNKPYDIIVLIRMKPFCEEIMRKNRILYSNEVDKEFLKNCILKENWEFDIPGFITLNDLKYIINNTFIIGKGCNLNEQYQWMLQIIIFKQEI